MNLTAMETYEQLKSLTSRAIELTRAGNLKDLGPTLGRMETAYAELKKVDPHLNAVQQAARKSGEEAALSVRVLAYSDDTNVLAAEAHLVAAEKALKAGDKTAAGEIYRLIMPGQNLRKYVDAQCTAKNDLKTRAATLDKILGS